MRCIKKQLFNSKRQAEAYVMDRQFARAIRAYLSLAEHRASDENIETDRGRSSGDRFGRRGTTKAETTSPTLSIGGDKDGELDEVGQEGDRRQNRGEDGSGHYANVFRMIEQHSLFRTVQVGRVKRGRRAGEGARGG